MQREKKHEWKRSIAAPTKRDFCDCCCGRRGVSRLDGARGKQQVWRTHVRTWDISGANVLYWRKYLWHCWDFMAPSAVIWRPHYDSDSAPGSCAPFVTPLQSSWHFCCGVEGAKHFMNVHYVHCIVSNIERIRKISSFPPVKVSADAVLPTWNFFKFLAFFRHVLVVSYLQIQQTKNLWIIEILINHFFAIIKVSRPETFETKTRRETFETETETRKNGSRDESRDQDQYVPFQPGQSRFLSWRPSQSTKMSRLGIQSARPG